MNVNISKEFKGADNELVTCSNGIPKFLLKNATNQIVSGISIMELTLEDIQCLIPPDIQLMKNKSVRNVSTNEKITATHPLMVTDFKSYP